MLAVIVPILVFVAVLAVDWISAAIMAVTLPLIPVFMALVGMATRSGPTGSSAPSRCCPGIFSTWSAA